MNKIVVEHFKQDDYLNVKVNKNGSIKTEENLELPDAYLKILEYKKQFGIGVAEFILYEGVNGDNGTVIYTREINV